MRYSFLVFILFLCLFECSFEEISQLASESEILQWLENYNKEALSLQHDVTLANFEWQKNLTDENQKKATELSAKWSQFANTKAAEAKNFDLVLVEDPGKKRQLQKIAAIEMVLNETDSTRFFHLVAKMTDIFSNGYVCNPSYPKCENSTNSTEKWLNNPDLDEIFGNSRDYELLKYAWEQFRESTGNRVLEMFKEYISLSNRGARQAGYPEMGASWRSKYEDPDFEIKIEILWRQLLPLYEQLHAYVRGKLAKNVYPGKFDTSALPAHIMGNQWSQTWIKLYKDTVPYPEEPMISIEDHISNFTAQKLFDLAEDFYTSLGLPPMTAEFKKRSMIERPKDGRKVVCYASAEDFYTGKDYGIKMCAKPTMEDLIIIHHEMGHIEYFMAYANQPYIFREAANPGFHEAIGDTMALSVGTPGHLYKVGLLDKLQPHNEKQTINYLYKRALDRISFLPFGYLIDKYRWDVFDGTIPLDQLNDGWWYLRYKYQGLVPPESRTNTQFDAGAKFHVDNNVPYVRYFVAFMAQFQFYKALCQQAGYSGPLHQCDFYNSTKAGSHLLEMLKMGWSQPWPEAMEKLTGQRELTAAPLMEYFRPLMQWLKKENAKNNACFGWGYDWPPYYAGLDTPRCPKVFETNPESSTKTPIEPEANQSPKDSSTDPIIRKLMIGALVLSVIIVLMLVVLVGVIFKKWREQHG